MSVASNTEIMSIAELNGNHPIVINQKSDRVYFILSGSGKVLVNDEIHDVVSNDLIFIPKNTKHSIRGKLEYIIITSPPFNPNNEAILEGEW